MSRFSLITGSIFGFAGVIAGAFGSHALKSVLSPDQLSAYQTAVEYQVWHALLLLILGLLMQKPQHKLLRYAPPAIAGGVILFSGSIYLLTLTPLKPGFVTPIGGLFIIIGWVLALLSFIFKKPHESLR